MQVSEEFISKLMSSGLNAREISQAINRRGRIRNKFVDLEKRIDLEISQHKQRMSDLNQEMYALQNACDHAVKTHHQGVGGMESYFECVDCGARFE